MGVFTTRVLFVLGSAFWPTGQAEAYVSIIGDLLFKDKAAHLAEVPEHQRWDPLYCSNTSIVMLAKSACFMDLCVLADYTV